MNRFCGKMAHFCETFNFYVPIGSKRFNIYPNPVSEEMNQTCGKLTPFLCTLLVLESIGPS